jgi:hypothetical protein
LKRPYQLAIFGTKTTDRAYLLLRHSVLNGYDVLKVLTILLKYVVLSAITHFLCIFQTVNFSVQNFVGGVDGSGILE